MLLSSAANNARNKYCLDRLLDSLIAYQKCLSRSQIWRPLFAFKSQVQSNEQSLAESLQPGGAHGPGKPSTQSLTTRICGLNGYTYTPTVCYKNVPERFSRWTTVCADTFHFTRWRMQTGSSDISARRPARHSHFIG